MTLREAISEMHALFPGRYVSVDVEVGWHNHQDAPGITVCCYAEGIGHMVWGAPSIDVAMQMVRTKHGNRPTGSVELAMTDADLTRGN